MIDFKTMYPGSSGTTDGTFGTRLSIGKYGAVQIGGSAAGFGFNGEHYGGLDIAYGGAPATLIVGAESNLTTRTNYTSKVGKIALAPYMTTANPVGLIGGNSLSSANNIIWGGGSSTLQAATQHDFYTATATNTPTGTSRLTIDSVGNIGINDTTPLNILDISLSSSATAKTSAFSGIAVNNTATSTSNIIKSGINISSTGTWSGATASNIGLYVSAVTGGTNNYDAIFNGGGNVGIGTTSPWRKLSVTGTAAFDGLTAAGASGDALCLSAGKEMVVNTGAQTCTVSSARFKNGIGNLDIGLVELMKLNPVSFKYNGSDEDRIGFIAEEVGQIDGRLIFTEEDGETPRGVRYEDMVAVVVSAVKELASTAREWVVAKITATLAIFNRVETKQLKTDELCLDDVCITKTQLQALLNSADINTSDAQTPIVLDDDSSDDSASTTESVATTTEEVIEDIGGDTGNSDDSDDNASTTETVIEDELENVGDQSGGTVTEGSENSGTGETVVEPTEPVESSEQDIPPEEVQETQEEVAPQETEEASPEN